MYLVKVLSLSVSRLSRHLFHFLVRSGFEAIRMARGAERLAQRLDFRL
jgi:hypothetical protein